MRLVNSIAKVQKIVLPKELYTKMGFSAILKGLGFLMVEGSLMN